MQRHCSLAYYSHNIRIRRWLNSRIKGKTIVNGGVVQSKREQDALKTLRVIRENKIAWIQLAWKRDY